MNCMHYRPEIFTEPNFVMRRINVIAEAAEKRETIRRQNAKVLSDQFKDLSKEEQLYERFRIRIEDLDKGRVRARDGKVYHQHVESGETYMWEVGTNVWFLIEAEAEAENGKDNDGTDDEFENARVVEPRNANHILQHFRDERDRYRIERIDLKPEKGTNIFEMRLDFKHPCSALFFSLHLNDSVNESFYPLDDLIHFKLQFNGQKRLSGGRDIALKLNKMDCKVLITPNVPVYALPFSLEPFNPTQPKGSTNFSRIDTVKFRVVTSDRVGCVRVWGLHTNVLRVMSGMAAQAFRS